MCRGVHLHLCQPMCMHMCLHGADEPWVCMDIVGLIHETLVNLCIELRIKAHATKKPPPDAQTPWETQI